MERKEENRVSEILQRLINYGENIITQDDIIIINRLSMGFIDGYFNDLKCINEILQISNILYNNTTKTVLPLEDGVYDLVVAKYDALTNNGAPVGAPPIKVSVKEEDIGSDSVITSNDSKLEIVGIIDTSNMQYFKNLIHNNYPDYRDYIIHDHIDPVVNNQTKISHNYPELVGTLHKAKFVTKYEAINSGIEEDDPSVKMFDRDFLFPYYNTAYQICARKGLPVQLIAELRYDGVSVEAEVCGDTIISACSRGDTVNDVATDLTPIFGGYKFHRAAKISKQYVFGIKFECIITKSNLIRLERDHNITYKNPRVAVIGLMGRLDAINFRDYLTLVPIKSSGIAFNDIEMELSFLNENYSSGVYMRYCIMQGDFNSLLAQVKKFTQEAEYMRDSLDFLYDGVVVSFTDPDVINYLGRVNDKDMWSMAIKFNASSKTAYFIGYSYTVGQDGRITPMAHFTPVEFLGTIHDKTTVHSLNRFLDLDLREGDIVLITYVNDVICYISKPENSYNELRSKTIPPIEFPDKCPFCGTDIIVSETGKSAYCPNINCPERMLGRITNTLKKLGIKDFGRSLLRKIGVRSLTELLDVDTSSLVEVLGEITSQNLQDRIDYILNTEWYDYRLFGAIGFTGISDVRWKSILEQIPYYKILTMDDVSLGVSLRHVKGIGETMIETILKERHLLSEDLKTINDKLNVISSYGVFTKIDNIRFSGVRNDALVEAFKSKGYDASGEKNVNNNTIILVVPYHGFNSNKTRKAISVDKCSIMTEQEAFDWLNRN